MTLNYQSHDVLKTSGTVVKVGEYQGANFDEKTGKPIPSKFGAFDIRRMHDNATEPIPIYVDLHGKDLSKRELAGWAFRVGISPDGKELAHNGFVFNPKAQKLVASGHNQISPEIETIKDAAGNIIDRKIEALCFVPSGAIDGTEVNYMIERFSTIDGMNGQTNNAGTNDAGTNPPATGQQIDVDAIVKSTAKAVLTELMPATKAMIDEAVSQVGQSTQGAEVIPQGNQTNPTDGNAAELAALKAQAAAQQQITDALVNEKYDSIVSQLKKLGIPDPSSLVPKEIPRIQATEILKGVATSIIERSELNGVPQGLGTQGTGQKTEEQNFNECMTELGFNSEHYRNMFK